MTVNADDFKSALRLWASGVTVVTAGSEQQGERGMTATSFASVSMEPPLILVCLNQTSDTGALVLERGCFAVNILTSLQEPLSNAFAGGGSQQQRFADCAWEAGHNGAPLLTEALASLECKVAEYVTAGSHWVVVGEVQRVVCRSGEPLLYYHSGYRELAAK
ncbi:MAG: flavin reductase family protein [Methylomonas sp.]|jgi:flavin reductase